MQLTSNVSPPGSSTTYGQAIITATLQALMEHGFGGLSMERVAELAGVGKATIYRRWKGKAELVAEALGSLRLEEPPADEGSLKKDMLAFSRRQLAVVRAQPRFPRLAPLLLAGSAVGIVVLKIRRVSGLRKTRESVQESLALLRREDQAAVAAPASTRVT